MHEKVSWPFSLNVARKAAQVEERYLHSGQGELAPTCIISSELLLESWELKMICISRAMKMVLLSSLLSVPSGILVNVAFPSAKP